MRGDRTEKVCHVSFISVSTNFLASFLCDFLNLVSSTKSWGPWGHFIQLITFLPASGSAMLIS